MSGNWSLNGVELYEVDVKLKPTALQVQQQFRQVHVPTHMQDDYREALGLSLPSFTISISLLGRGDSKYATLREITDAIDSQEVWTLAAPSDLHVFVYKNFKRAAFSAESWSFDPGHATGKIVLTINATLNGIWIADGGDYAEPLADSFTLSNLAPATYLRGNDGEFTTPLPLLKLRLQVAGYPLAVRLSDLTWATVPVTNTYVEDGITYGDYNMTGFLHPAPVAVNDVGAFHVLSAPYEPAGTFDQASVFNVGGNNSFGIIMRYVVTVGKTIEPGVILPIAANFTYTSGMATAPADTVTANVTATPSIGSTGASITQAFTVSATVTP